MLIQLQYIRALAALLVVYFHAILQIQKLDPGAFLSGAAFGECGVDLFFVLSGFVMWITTSGKASSTTTFYAKRARRILPLYWSATLLAASVALAAPSILKSTVFDPPHVVASLLFIPWINPADPLGSMIAPVIVPGWTLNYEMYFYLVFGLMLLLPRSARLTATLAVFSLIWLVCQLLPADSTPARFYGSLVVFEFLAGAVIGSIYMSGHRLAAPPAAALAVIAVQIMLMVDASHLQIDRLFKFGILAASVVYAATAVDQSRVPKLTWLRYVGDASYSIYITHIFVLAGARMLYPRLPLDLMRNEFVFLAICLVLSTLVGALVHWLFEAPIDRYLNRNSSLQRLRSPERGSAPAE